MRTILFATISSLIALSACQQGEDPEALGDAAANNATSTAAAPAAEPSAANAAAASLPTQALAGEQAQALMNERHENYEKMGDAMKLISRQLKADSPDLTAVRSGARTIATLAPQIPSWFPPGTGPDAGKTDAKAEIWQNPKDFEAKAAAFNEAASAFNGAAQGTDLAAIRAAHGNLGKTCKACHDLYREEH